MKTLYSRLIFAKELTVFWVISISGIPLNLLATTISPYPNMGALQASADKIVYVESILDSVVQIRSIYKGRLPNTFAVKKYAPEGAVIFGDVELSSGKNYLLFLDQNDKPICLSYYIYEEVGFNLIPVEKAYEVHSIRGEEHGGYNRDSLLTALRGYGPFPKMQRRVDTKRAAPSHCTWLSSGGRKFRWKEMPVTALYTVDTSSCNAHTLVNQALVDLNNAFQNITYLNGGQTVHATCGGGIPTAVGTSYRNWINANYNPATGVVFFNDPCNEINDLSDCHGVLAFGGGSGIGTHNFRGEIWYTMQYPFVVMNNGLDVCHCDVVDLIIKHELTHTLGIGHISSNYGQALMNPFCCADIMQLDVDCLDYTYPCGVLNEWVGGVSNNWVDAGNWTAGIPDTCHSVVIPEGDSVSIRVNEKGIAGLIEVNGQLDVKGELEVFYGDIFIDTSECLGFSAFFDYIPNVNCEGAKIKPRLFLSLPCTPDSFLWYLNGDLTNWTKDSLITINPGDTHTLVQSCSELECIDTFDFSIQRHPDIYITYNAQTNRVELTAPLGLERRDVDWYCKIGTGYGWAYCTGTSYTTYTVNAFPGYRYYARVTVSGVEYFTDCVITP